MAVALRKDGGQNGQDRQSESERLLELRMEAAAIRRDHEAGKMSADDAEQRLRGLKDRYLSLFDILFMR